LENGYLDGRFGGITDFDNIDIPLHETR